MPQELQQDTTEESLSKSNDKFNKVFSPRAADPKAAKYASQKTKPKKQMSTTAVAIITLAAMLLVIGGAGTGFYMIGLLDPILPLVGIAPRAEKLSFEQKKEELAALEEKLDLREEAVKDSEEELASQSAELESREKAVEEREKALISFADVIQSTSEERLKALKKVSLICNEMDADAAAGIVGKMANLDEIALVVYYMTETKAAQLLDLLPEATSARVLSLIMQ